MSDVSDSDKMGLAQQFFRDLVNPTNFPRDYIGFIMKIMKLMQIKYAALRQIEVELKLVQQLSEPPSRPSMSLMSLMHIQMNTLPSLPLLVILVINCLAFT